MKSDLRFVYDSQANAKYDRIIKAFNDRQLDRAKTEKGVDVKLQEEIREKLKDLEPKIKTFAKLQARIAHACSKQHLFLERLLNLARFQNEIGLYELFCPTIEECNTKDIQQRNSDLNLEFCWYLYDNDGLERLTAVLIEYCNTVNRYDDISMIQDYIIPTLRKFVSEPKIKIII